MAAAVLAVKATASAASMAVAPVDSSLVLEETVEVGPLVGAALDVAWLFVGQCHMETGQTQVSFASNHHTTTSHPWINASSI